MANIASAKKRARQNIKRRAHNSAQRSQIRTYIKRVIKLAQAHQKEEALRTYKQAQPLMDRSVNKKLFTKNKIARLKSHLIHRINEIND